ncbi:MAG: D-alanyl-D-alanine carboxypeptidase [Candidatus Adiutrix sp.]|jgi:D-alanyl-D-alanine carboxypeptidase/D-alanyl-D-alanine-endopeptidase (penicillin-binding protein 4)|nr:D-alanyl-D-alanine carboxypeptidase [Candidatus Adiutrix sp.]
MIRGFVQHIKLLYLAALALALALALAWPPDLAAAPQNSARAKTSTKSKKKGSQKQPAQQAAPLPWPQNLLALLGDGAVLVVDHHDPEKPGKALYAHNAEKPYVPASILKIVTSGAALEFLGPEYRFKTDFLLTRDKDLWVVGYGDPYLVSEELTTVVEALQKRGLKEVRDLYLDNSFFEKDLILDGNTRTDSPFDAYNLAFGVNFNTVCFQKTKKGQVSKASAHIPLTPLALELAPKFKKAGVYRLNVSESPGRAELHAGQTFQAHLEGAGIKVTGEIVLGRSAPLQRKVFYRHLSSRTLAAVVQDLMKYSNNFMTNQIFLALGAELYGAPATLEKSQKAMDAYFQKYNLAPIVMGDGSGLSRQTTLTASQMADVLAVVEADRRLLVSRDDGQVFYKTGTMSDIKTLAGYIERPGEPERPLAFVILLNGHNFAAGARDKILGLIKSEFASAPSAGR